MERSGNTVNTHIEHVALRDVIDEDEKMTVLVRRSWRWASTELDLIQTLTTLTLWKP